MKKALGIGCIFFIHLVRGQIPVYTVQELNTQWQFKNTDETGWKNAEVPGTVIGNFTTLENESDPSHPYYGDMEKTYQWIEHKDWEFITRFYSNDHLLSTHHRCLLQLDGVDLFADIYLNDQLVLQTNNAFIPWEKEISTYLKKDGTENILRVVFISTIKKSKELADKNGITLPGGERVYARKPAYEFGWDWGPRFVNIGIRKYIRLVYAPSTCPTFGEMVIAEKGKTGKNVQLEATIDIESEKDLSLTISYTSLLDGQEWAYKYPEKPLPIKKGHHTYHFPILIKNAEKWWPNGLGKQPVYDLHFNITDSLGQQSYYQKNIPYAHCEVQLVREKDKAGESFYFKINGKKIFTKGANFIPDDSFDPGKNTEAVVYMAKIAGMNMLRVWGGGTYPDDDFYTACIRNGILVWQDFMFACAMYPGDTGFIQNVKTEAGYHVKRLVNYNNIALWCGNNENDEGWQNWGWQKEFKYTAADSLKITNDYIQVFECVLPAAVHQYDKNIAYIPSSPQYGWGRKKSMTHGDSHYWGVWWGRQPIDTFQIKIPRFMSEYGMQAMPDVSTLQKSMPDTSFYRNSTVFKNHQKHPTGYETIDHYLKEELVTPTDLEAYAYATEILQSITLTMAIEAQRRAMPYCMGTLLWQLNDCWPVTSWSIIDDQLHPKLGYEAVKKAYQPQIISVKKEKDRYDIYIINDGMEKIKDSLFLYIADFTGKKILEKKIRVSIKPSSSAIYASFSVEELKNINLRSVYMHVYTTSKKEECFYYFTHLKDLHLPPTHITIKQEKTGYILSSDVLAPYGILYENDNRIFVPVLLPGQPVYITSEKPVEKPLVRFLNGLLN